MANANMLTPDEFNVIKTRDGITGLESHGLPPTNRYMSTKLWFTFVGAKNAFSGSHKSMSTNEYITFSIGGLGINTLAVIVVVPGTGSCTNSDLISTQITFTLAITFTLTVVSCYSDTDFLHQLSKQYSPALIERLFKDQVKERITAIGRVASSPNLNDDQIGLCNVTLSSLLLFNDYIDQSIPSFQTCGFAASDRLKHFIKQYEIIIGLFNDEFKSMNLPEAATFETPDSLLKLMDSKPADFIRLAALQSIASYKHNVGLFYKEASRYESTLADSTIKQLDILHNEIDKLNITSPATPSVTKSLRIVLERFKLIIKIFKMRQLVSNLIVILISSVAIVSPLEEADFLRDLSSTYSPPLIEQLLKDQINHRINSIVEIRRDGKINKDQVAFCNITLQSLALLHDSVDKLSSSSQDIKIIAGDSPPDLLYAIKQYEIIVNLFNEQFELLRFAQADVETPDSLLKSINLKTDQWIKSSALKSIDKYIDLIEKLASSEVKKYPTLMIDLSVKQLSSLKVEIESIVTSNTLVSPAIKPLDLALKKFKVIIKTLAASQYK
uniref:Uncharacterized protein n=2 Tax=Tetranychus urticae TaxID=32264 RepID=T1KA37_TETUR